MLLKCLITPLIPFPKQGQGILSELLPSTSMDSQLKVLSIPSMDVSLPTVFHHPPEYNLVALPTLLKYSGKSLYRMVVVLSLAMQYTETMVLGQV
jgi:hypothetical protein